MAITKPTVGRQVYYRPSAADMKGEEAMRGSAEGPFAATVVAVHSDTMVNLLVLDDNGTAFKRPSVLFIHEAQLPISGGRYCEWMAYQVKQHAKHANEDADSPKVPNA